MANFLVDALGGKADDWTNQPHNSWPQGGQAFYHVKEKPLKEFIAAWNKQKDSIDPILKTLRKYDLVVSPNLPAEGKEGTAEDEREKLITWYRDEHCTFKGDETITQDDEYTKYGHFYGLVRDHAPKDSLRMDMLTYMRAAHNDKRTIMMINVSCLVF
eukprot:TRINITY_DN42839_c0_g1_i2.p1 TRINITY_DN42839_c0_g1~~TRINITY_DN42839_c0_g1_i2.p1  ORF type:complete len:158 (-),score=16.34 TRINITY_DN42839_c0_g1_i2:191-664(-)